MTKFKLRATEKDPSGYYYPRWDLAMKLEIESETKEKAFEKARSILGPTEKRKGWEWAIKIDEIISA